MKGQLTMKHLSHGPFCNRMISPIGNSLSNWLLMKKCAWRKEMNAYSFKKKIFEKKNKTKQKKADSFKEFWILMV